MRLIRLLGFLLAVFRSYGFAQQPVISVTGTVRDTAHRPLVGADIFIGQLQATTNAQGAFRIDSLRPGQYPVTIRRVGYTPQRARITLAVGKPTEFDFILEPSPFRLPTIVSEVQRTGIYGTVTDSSLRPAPGARIQVVGFQGGDMLTDSAGRFAFPKADDGAYLVRVTLKGYAERRVSLELPKGTGRELAIRLSAGASRSTHADEQAFKDLRLRLATSFRRERLAGVELERHGDDFLCNVRMEGVGNPSYIIVNGVDIYRGMPRSFLCFWRANDLELVEFGPDVCREISGTLRYFLNPRSCGSYVVIWEKR